MAPSNSQAAASLMLRALLLWQSKARKDYLISHCRLAFCTATKIVLAFVSRAAGSTATTWRKSAIEETMFRKVLLSSALIFFCKRYLHDQRHFFFFTFICIWNRVRSVLFQTVGHVIVRDIIFRDRTLLYFVFLAAWWSFRHAFI